MWLLLDPKCVVTVRVKTRKEEQEKVTRREGEQKRRRAEKRRGGEERRRRRKKWEAHGNILFQDMPPGTQFLQLFPIPFSVLKQL